MSARAREAHACGGCLGPPPDPHNPTGVQTVTDHRMALALSATQTTLWDQFSWSGNPADFSWILPVANGPDVRVELASDDFLTLLDNDTSPQGQTPSVPSRACGYCYPQGNCFAQSPGGGGSGGFADASASASSDAGRGGVTVFRQEVLGPYELVVLGGNDASALRDWLTMHHFSVPASLEPTIAYYVNLHMSFVALRLAGSDGVSRMQPVRVTTPGAQYTLPLRMVAAGVSDKVGLLLFVIANARMEAMNFPNTEIRESDLVWDYSDTHDPNNLLQFATDFRSVEQALSRSQHFRAWNTETAFGDSVVSLESLAQRFDSYAMSTGRDAGVTADAGPRPLAATDVMIATQSLGSTSPYLTRLRAELPYSALDRDLVLAASVGVDRARSYQYGVMRNTPTPAACPALDCMPGWVRYEPSMPYMSGPYGEVLPGTATFGATYTPGAIATIDPPAWAGTLIPGGPDASGNCSPPVFDAGTRGDAGTTTVIADGATTVVLSDGGTGVILSDGAVVPVDAGDAPRGGCSVATSHPSSTRSALSFLALGSLAAVIARRRRRTAG